MKERIDEPEIKDVSQIVGEYLIDLVRNWRPQPGQSAECIGTLYGFNCWIKREEAITNAHEDLATRNAMGGTNIMSSNKLYVQHPDGGLRYTFNDGRPSTASPKVASRIFLSSVDRCVGLLENTYRPERSMLIRDIKQLSEMEEKPFDREDEIRQLREDSKRLGAEINDKILSRTTVPEEKEQVPVPADEEDDDTLPF